MKNTVIAENENNLFKAEELVYTTSKGVVNMLALSKKQIENQINKNRKLLKYNEDEIYSIKNDSDEIDKVKLIKLNAVHKRNKNLNDLIAKLLYAASVKKIRLDIVDYKDFVETIDRKVLEKIANNNIELAVEFTTAILSNIDSESKLSIIKELLQDEGYSIRKLPKKV